jgi:hypothetical protein
MRFSNSRPVARRIGFLVGPSLTTTKLLIALGIFVAATSLSVLADLVALFFTRL